MHTVETIKEQIHAIKGPLLITKRPEINELPALLGDDSIEQITQATFEKHNGILMVTTKELLFVAKDAGPVFSKSFPLSSLHTVLHTAAFAIGTLSLETEQGPVVFDKVSDINKGLKFSHYLRSRVDGTPFIQDEPQQSVASPRVAPTPSIKRQPLSPQRRNTFLILFALVIAFWLYATRPWESSTPPQSVPSGSSTSANSNSSAATAPTSKPVPTTSALKQAADGYASGGLGLNQASWEANHTYIGKGIVGLKYDRRYEVSFMDERIWYIEQEFKPGIAPSDVEKMLKTLIPNDSKLIRKYSPSGRPEATVYLYSSNSLKDRFSKDAFINGDPGNFTLQYNTFDGKVNRGLVALGNNP